MYGPNFRDCGTCFAKKNAKTRQIGILKGATHHRAANCLEVAREFAKMAAAQVEVTTGGYPVLDWSKGKAVPAGSRVT
jgi:hypothetical protein